VAPSEGAAQLCKHLSIRVRPTVKATNLSATSSARDQTLLRCVGFRCVGSSFRLPAFRLSPVHAAVFDPGTTPPKFYGTHPQDI
jgi:hypothetical protein